MREPHGSTRNTDLQAGIEVGYLCRSIEQELNSIAAKTSGGRTARELAAGMGNLLLSKARGSVLDYSEHLSEVRRQTANGYEKSATSAEVHVRARGYKALTGTVKKTRKSGRVTCRACNHTFADRSKYLHHRYKKHPELLGRGRRPETQPLLPPGE